MNKDNLENFETSYKYTQKIDTLYFSSLKTMQLSY